MRLSRDGRMTMSEKWMLLIAEDPSEEKGLPDSFWHEHDRRHEKFAEQITAVGATILASEPLSDQAVTFRPAPDGEILVTDGPFAETKEMVLGFYLIEVADEAQARELAALCPTLGSLELRAVQHPLGK
jgi:hypothetical protein